jgi:hypothetical protein
MPKPGFCSKFFLNFLSGLQTSFSNPFLKDFIPSFVLMGRSSRLQKRIHPPAGLFHNCLAGKLCRFGRRSIHLQGQAKPGSHPVAREETKRPVQRWCSRCNPGVLNKIPASTVNPGVWPATTGLGNWR